MRGLLRSVEMSLKAIFRRLPRLLLPLLVPLLVLFPSLALGVVAGVPTGGPKDPLNLDPVIGHFAFPGVELTVRWEACGQVNAFYDGHGHVIMCTELVRAMTPGQIRFILAHELSHGVIHQLELPTTGSSEVAADYLAAYILYFGGNSRDILEMARYFFQRGGDEDPADPHPGNVRRGLYLYCLGKGPNPPPTAIWCGSGDDGIWNRNRWVWTTLLETAQKRIAEYDAS